MPPYGSGFILILVIIPTRFLFDLVLEIRNFWYELKIKFYRRGKKWEDDEYPDLEKLLRYTFNKGESLSEIVDKLSTKYSDNPKQLDCLLTELYILKKKGIIFDNNMNTVFRNQSLKSRNFRDIVSKYFTLG